MGDGIAERIVSFGRSDAYQMCISVLTAANVMYIAPRYLKTFKPTHLQDLFCILLMTSGQWNDAASIDSEDFEDSLQMACAIDAQCNMIVTRDASHFRGSIIKVYSPEEFSSLVPISIIAG